MKKRPKRDGRTVYFVGGWVSIINIHSTQSMDLELPNAFLILFSAKDWPDSKTVTSCFCNEIGREVNGL